MDARRRQLVIQYAKGIPIGAILYGLACLIWIFFCFAHIDSAGAANVPLWVDTIHFILAFPFLSWLILLPPSSTPEGVIGGILVITSLILNAIFWGFVGMFCYRFIGRARLSKRIPNESNTPAGL